MFTDSVAVAVGTGCHHYPAVTSIPLTPIRGTRMRSDSGSRIRFAEAFGKGGIVVGLGGVCHAACVATSAFRQRSGLPWGFEVHCLADWGNFSRTKCLTCSLDSTSLHRGYVGCAGALADSLLAALLAREAGPCSPWLHWLLSLAGAACRATFTFRRHLHVACMLAMSIDLHATH